jgi:hypothetical protein
MLILIGCVNQNITSPLAKTSKVEGRRYAKEVDEQSPFKTVEIPWIEAGELIKERNPSFISASSSYSEALVGKPLVGELTREVKTTVAESIGSIFDIDNLVSTFKKPTFDIPKQIVSISRLKDVNHEIKKDAWEDAGKSIDAELQMRKVEVQLHRLMRTGQLIDREMLNASRDPKLDPDSINTDPKFPGALAAWRASLKSERSNWLAEVRDLFDAEYHDVRFIPDDSGLPTYRNADNPDLGKWKRWCHLGRSKELISTLTQYHKENKPTLPGTAFVTKSLKQMVNQKDSPVTTVRKTDSVRKEVRTLIQSWRSMKETQEQADILEEMSGDLPILTQGEIKARQKIFQLRKAEIRYVSIVWLLDENCWRNS